MAVVSVIYHSGYGHTEKVATSVVAGVRSVSQVEVNVFPIHYEQLHKGRWQDEAVLAELSGSDAIIFGAPTYMGMVSGQFKCFADATAPFWMDGSWQDKIAGGFTSSGYPLGDKVMTLHYLATLAAQLRMLWVGPTALASSLTGDGQDVDRWGFYLGVGVVGNMQEENSPSAGDLRTAELYGERLAAATLRWLGTAPAETAQKAHRRPQ